MITTITTMTTITTIITITIIIPATSTTFRVQLEAGRLHLHVGHRLGGVNKPFPQEMYACKHSKPQGLEDNFQT